MFRSMIQRCSVVLAFAALVAGRPVTAVENTGIVLGRVADSQGQGVPDVVVNLTGASLRSPLSAKTQADGAFSFQDVPAPGRYSVATVLGGSRSGARPLVVEPGATVQIELAAKPSFLDEVTVTATREEVLKKETSLTVDTVGRDTLAEVKPTHPGQIMNRVPGVWVGTTGGEGHMTAIRQPLTTNPVYLFLEDGVPSRSTGFFNHNALYEINVPQADGIEVTKGPGSALYGSDAIGGVVNVLTRSPFGASGLDGSLEGGSYGFRRGLVSGNVARNADAVRADVNLTHTDGWRDSTGYDRQAGSLRWDRASGNGWLIKTLVSYSRIDQETAGTSALQEDDYLNNPTWNLTPISLRNVEAFRASTELRREFTASSLSLIPYFRYDSMDLLPNWTLTFDPTFYNTNNTSYGMLAKFRRDFTPLRAQLVAGLDFDLSPGERLENQIKPGTTKTITGKTVFSSYTTGAVIYDYAATFLGLSPYAQMAFSPTDRLRVDLGLRFDHFGYDYDDRLATPETTRYRRPADTSRSYDHASPKAGLTYQVSDRVNAFASYRHAFRAPSEGQLFRQGSALNTIDLKPVKAENYEVGVRVAPARQVSLEVSVYRLNKRDDILSFRDPLDGATQAVNAGRTRHQGVEVGVNAAPVSWLSLSGAYSFAKHTYEEWVVDPARGVDYSGLEQETAPHQIGNLAVTVSPEGKGSFSVEVFHLGSYWMDAANTSSYDGHTLVNLRARVPVYRGLKLYARMLNATDQRYAETSSYTISRGREFAPGLPRTLYAGLELDLRR